MSILSVDRYVTGHSVCYCRPYVHHCFGLGERVPDSTRYCYCNNRETEWRPHPCRQLDDLIQPLNEIDQEERMSIRQNLAKNIGFNGTSILHRLHPLYGFDITKDFVIDLQHGLPLNPVKHEFEAILALLETADNSNAESHGESGKRNVVQVISDDLDCVPWTSGFICQIISIYNTNEQIAFAYEIGMFEDYML